MSTSHRLPRGSGFGLIEMPDTTTHATMYGLNGTSLRGRTLTINEARWREERRPRWVVSTRRGLAITSL